MVKIFDIENEQVVLNENCLTVPELVKIVETYEDCYMTVFQFLYHMTDIVDSAYKDVPTAEKLKVVYKDFKDNYHPEDKEIVEALDKLNYFNNTDTTTRFYISVKTAVDKMSLYLSTVMLNDSKEDGNIQHVQRMIEKCGTIITQFKKVEKEKNEETLKARGNAKIAYDL